MYYFYLDKLLLPVTPKSVTIAYAGNNRTYNLIDDDEINVLKKSRLCDIAFDFLLPSSSYAFSDKKAKDPEEYLKVLKNLKLNKKPFQFIIIRKKNFKSNNLLSTLVSTFAGGGATTNIKVSLEDYAVKEDADNGIDYIVSVKLKEYREYGTKTVTVDANGNATINNTRDTSTAPQVPATTLVGTDTGNDSLWKIAKKYYGTGDVWSTIADNNGITNYNDVPSTVIMPRVQT